MMRERLSEQAVPVMKKAGRGIIALAIAAGGPIYEKFNSEIIEAAPGGNCQSGFEAILPDNTTITVAAEDAKTGVVVGRRTITGRGRELFLVAANDLVNGRPAFRARIFNEANQSKKLETIAPCGEGAIVDFKKFPELLIPVPGFPATPGVRNEAGAGAGSGSTSNANAEINITLAGTPFILVPSVPRETETPTPTFTSTPTVPEATAAIAAGVITPTLGVAIEGIENGNPVSVVHDWKDWLAWALIIFGGATIAGLLAGRGGTPVVLPLPSWLRKEEAEERTEEKKEEVKKEKTSEEDLEKRVKDLEQENTELTSRRLSASIRAQNAQAQIDKLVQKNVDLEDKLREVGKQAPQRTEQVTKLEEVTTIGEEERKRPEEQKSPEKEKQKKESKKQSPKKAAPENQGQKPGGPKEGATREASETIQERVEREVVHRIDIPQQKKPTQEGEEGRR